MYFKTISMVFVTDILESLFVWMGYETSGEELPAKAVNPDFVRLIRVMIRLL
jgi:hypothetical protein